jgi:hypothetical protein
VTESLDRLPVIVFGGVIVVQQGAPGRLDAAGSGHRGQLLERVGRQDAAAPVSKLGARSRTQAVEQARALGLLAPFLSQAPIGGLGA